MGNYFAEEVRIDKQRSMKTRDLNIPKRKQTKDKVLMPQLMTSSTEKEMMGRPVLLQIQSTEMDSLVNRTWFITGSRRKERGKILQNVVLPALTVVK